MKSRAIGTVATTVIILASSVILGSLVVLYGTSLFQSQAYDSEKSNYVEPDVTGCMRTVMDPDNYCQEVYAYYDESSDRYKWEIQFQGWYEIQWTKEPIPPTAEEFCIMGTDFGVENCMDYLILEELKKLNSNEPEVILKPTKEIEVYDNEVDCGNGGKVRNNVCHYDYIDHQHSIEEILIQGVTIAVNSSRNYSIEEFGNCLLIISMEHEAIFDLTIQNNGSKRICTEDERRDIEESFVSLEPVLEFVARHELSEQ